MTKPHTGKFIKCLGCSKEFYIPLNRYSTAKYCSKKCKNKFNTVKIITNCVICSKQFEHISSRANKAKYCSRICYHKGQNLKGTKEYKCYHCEKLFLDSPSRKRKFCSKKCVNKNKKSEWNPIFSTIRKGLKNINLIKICNRCVLDKYPEILGIHHKDRNRHNNSMDNLEILCPNCHSLEHHKHICH